jgi:hypothetical protein
MAINKEEYYSRIVHNSVRCHKCGNDIESKNRHDFKWCKCGNVAVDGGQSYLKRAYIERHSWTETSEHELLTISEIEAKVEYYLKMAEDYDSPHFQEVAEFGTILLEELKND